MCFELNDCHEPYDSNNHLDHQDYCWLTMVFSRYLKNGAISLGLFFLNFGVIFLVCIMVFQYKRINAKSGKSFTEDHYIFEPAAVSTFVAHMQHTKTGIKVSVSATFELPSPFSCRSPLMQCGKLVLMVRTPLYLGVLIV